MDRIKRLTSLLTPCKTFADVGCDHGYCTQYMLKNGLCERAIISDISPKSLKKAENLLKDYIVSGKCTPVCCDGLEKIEGVDLVLISGLGGEEIINILRRGYIPPKFLLQPMKNAEKLRGFLINSGCGIEEDDFFYSGGKYYFYISGRKEGTTAPYTPAELGLGKGSLKNPLIKDYLKTEIEKLRLYLAREMSEDSRADVVQRLNFLTEVYESGIK